MKRREAEGSFSVEAAFLFPTVTLIVMILLLLTMYLRDLTVARSIVLSVAEEGRALIERHVGAEGVVQYEKLLDRGLFERMLAKEEEEEPFIRQILAQKLSGRLWISECLGANVTISGGELEIKVSIVSDGGIVGLVKWLPGDLFRDDICVCVKCRDVGTRTRMYTAIFNTGMRVKYVREILAELSELIRRFGR